MARYAADAGVGRLFVDLEIQGKQARQGHLSTVISRHTMADVSAVRKAVPDRELMVRLNPWHDESIHEVDEAIDRGADLLMLPMFSTLDEVASVCGAARGRAGVIPLVETPGAMQCLTAVLAVQGVREIYMGLNDMHLALGLRFMFQLLADGTVDEFSAAAREARVPFGFGGVARAGEGQLPADLIMKEHARLGSSRVILSRAFHRQAACVEDLKENVDFPVELEKLMQAYEKGMQMGEAARAGNHQQVVAAVERILG